jgi:hypothetical protein
MPDGSKAHFTMQMMDHAAGFSHTFADGTPDHNSPFKPGFRVLDTNDSSVIAAETAYRERSRRMEDAWKRKAKAPDDDEDEEDDPLVQRPGETESAWLRRQALARKAAQAVKGDARELADAAWEARNERLRNGWRNNRE